MERCEKQKLYKESNVSDANTCSYPWTMMIMYFDANAAFFTVK